jgi:hypothetical protein
MTFTGVLSLVTAIQVIAFIQSERAFAIVPDIEFVGGLVANKDIRLVIQIVNGGKSTARGR